MDLGSQDSLSWVERDTTHPQGGNTLCPRNVGFLAVKHRLLLRLMLQNTASTCGLQNVLWSFLSSSPLSTEQRRNSSGDDLMYSSVNSLPDSSGKDSGSWSQTPGCLFGGQRPCLSLGWAEVRRGLLQPGLEQGAYRVLQTPGAQLPQLSVSLQPGRQLAEVKFTTFSSYSRKHSEDAHYPQATEQGFSLSVWPYHVVALGSNPDLLTQWPWASYLSSPSFKCFIHKMWL